MRFDESFTLQEPIDDAAIAAAGAVMRSGRLHRYNTAEGEHGQTDPLEVEFGDYLGVSDALACASGGHAIGVALRAAGVQPGDVVLSNAFTLASVPGWSSTAAVCRSTSRSATTAVRAGV